MNREKLSDNRNEYLEEILQNHHNLAVCYAMKEEMCELFRLTGRNTAEKRWTEWFNAAKASEIPALVKFAELKEKRLPGLIAHAEYNLNSPLNYPILPGATKNPRSEERGFYGGVTQI